MSFEISATTKLEPQLIQVLVPDLINLKARLEKIESKESVIKQKTEEKEMYEFKAKPRIIKNFCLGFLIFILMINTFSDSENIVTLCLIGVSPFAVPLALHMYKKKKYTTLAKKAEQEIAQLSDPYISELSSVTEEYNYIPPDMMFSYAVDKLIQIVQYNRAENWMGALNLLQQEIHMDKMEITQALHNQAMMHLNS